MSFVLVAVPHKMILQVHMNVKYMYLWLVLGVAPHPRMQRPARTNVDWSLFNVPQAIRTPPKYDGRQCFNATAMASEKECIYLYCVHSDAE